MDKTDEPKVTVLDEKSPTLNASIGVKVEEEHDIEIPNPTNNNDGSVNIISSDFVNVDEFLVSDELANDHNDENCATGGCIGGGIKNNASLQQCNVQICPHEKCNTKHNKVQTTQDGDDAVHNTTRTCRICLDDDHPNELIAPCKCKGGSKWVHRSCLNKWRATNSQDIAFSKCLECRTAYQLVLAQPDQTERSKKVTFCLFVTRDMVLATIAVQVIIALFGLLFWVIALDVYNQDADDPNQTQLLGSCESTRCVIGLCYVGGALLMFLCLGLMGVFNLLLNDCSVDRSLESWGYQSSNNQRSGNANNTTTVTNSSNNSNGCLFFGYGDCDSGGGGEVYGVFLILLLLIAIVVAAIGFLVGCFIAAFLTQQIIQRHLWRLQKRRLANEYIVKDLSNDVYHNSTTTTTSTTTSSSNDNTLQHDDLETGMTNTNNNRVQCHPQPSAPPLPEIDSMRLRRLGLLQ